MSWTKIFTPIIDVYNSFKTNNDGLSGRKLSSFWAIVIVSTGLSFKFGNSKNVVDLVQLWLLFALLTLGLVTIPDLIRFIVEFKNKGATPNDPNSQKNTDPV